MDFPTPFNQNMDLEWFGDSDLSVLPTDPPEVISDRIEQGKKLQQSQQLSEHMLKHFLAPDNEESAIVYTIDDYESQGRSGLKIWCFPPSQMRGRDFYTLVSFGLSGTEAKQSDNEQRTEIICHVPASWDHLDGLNRWPLTFMWSIMSYVIETGYCIQAGVDMPNYEKHESIFRTRQEGGVRIPFVDGTKMTHALFVSPFEHKDFKRVDLKDGTIVNYKQLLFLTEKEAQWKEQDFDHFMANLMKRIYEGEQSNSSNGPPVDSLLNPFRPCDVEELLPRQEGEDQVSSPQTEGEDQVSSPQTEGEDQESSPQTEGVDQTEGEDQISSPQTEGEDQVSSPQTEGEDQVSSPETEGDQTSVTSKIRNTEMSSSALRFGQWAATSNGQKNERNRVHSDNFDEKQTFSNARKEKLLVDEGENKSLGKFQEEGKNKSLRKFQKEGKDESLRKVQEEKRIDSLRKFQEEMHSRNSLQREFSLAPGMWESKIFDISDFDVESVTQENLNSTKRTTLPETATSHYDVIATVYRGSKLVPKDRNLLTGRRTTSDPYVCIYYTSHMFGKTSTVWKTLNPQWGEHGETFALTVGSSILEKNKNLEFKIFDYDTLSKDDPMGTAVVTLPIHEPNAEITKWCPVSTGFGADYCKNATGNLLVKVEVRPSTLSPFDASPKIPRCKPSFVGLAGYFNTLRRTNARHKCNPARVA